LPYGWNIPTKLEGAAVPTLLIAFTSLLLSNVTEAAQADEPVEDAPIRLVVHEPVLRLYVHASSSAPPVGPSGSRAFANVPR
jgi:hypothetical protein